MVLAPETLALYIFVINVPTEVKGKYGSYYAEADKGEEEEKKVHAVPKLFFFPENMECSSFASPGRKTLTRFSISKDFHEKDPTRLSFSVEKDDSGYKMDLKNLKRQL